jgi:hypothetical protein
VYPTLLSRPSTVQIDTVWASCCQDSIRASYGCAACHRKLIGLVSAREGRLHRRRGDRDRHRWPGAGHPETLTLRDRLLLTLAWLRLALPHQALGLLYGVDRSTVSAAIRQIRPLLANRGFATPTGQRLHTLADILAYAAAEGVTIRLDGTEIQVRRPQANQPGRRAFVSGKKKQNTIKAIIASDAHGRPLWTGAIRPGRQFRPRPARCCQAACPGPRGAGRPHRRHRHG